MSSSSSDSSPDRFALRGVLAYVALVFGLWLVYVSFLYPFVAGRPDAAARVFLGTLARVCVFVAPVIFYLRYVSREEPLGFLKLRGNVSRGVLWGVAVGAVYASLTLGRAALFKEGGVDPKPVPPEALFTALTLSTLIEEVAFRGFVLQKLNQVVKFGAANALASCLFVAIHFPGWVIVGRSTLVPGKVIPMAEIFVLGLLLGYLLKRTRSLWPCFIVHAVNNAASIILFS